MTRTRWLLVGLAVLLLLVGVPSAMFVSAPLQTLRWAQRKQLEAVMGAPRMVAAPRGPMAVWHAGEGDGPTWALVHGFGDSGAGWAGVAGTLAEQAPVVVLDLPGHGASAPAEPPLGFADVLGGLEAALATVDGPVVLVGNSLGGWLVLRYALDHPDRVDRVVLLNSAGLVWPVDKGVLLPTTREGQRAKNVAVMGERAPWLPGFVLDGFLEDAADPRLQSLWDDLGTGHHLDDRLAEVQVPVEVVWGIGDGFFPLDPYAMKFVDGLPAARLTELPGCAHSPQYSCPDVLAEALLARMAEPPPG